MDGTGVLAEVGQATGVEEGLALAARGQPGLARRLDRTMQRDQQRQRARGQQGVLPHQVGGQGDAGGGPIGTGVARRQGESGGGHGELLASCWTGTVLPASII